MEMEIARMGHPVLLNRAKEVENIFSEECRRVASALLETHDALGGVGLAAPQIYIPLRMFVLEITEQKKLERGLSESYPKTVFINPEMEVIDEREVLGYEACLSIPEMMGKVPRFEKIRYRAMSPEGEELSGILSGYTARVFQHEFDHLNGILYPMRIRDQRDFGFMTEMQEAAVDV